MISRWTFDSVIKATGGQMLGGGGLGAQPIFGVIVDHRDTAPGDMFIALKGAKTDGHRFVSEALALGAAAVLVSSQPDGVEPGDSRLIFVDDTYEALWDLARASRARSKAKFIAITGSVGKTGTKEALYRALDLFEQCHASEKSLNTHVGVPLTMARMPVEAEFGVFEIGMNAPGEIGPLAQLVNPDLVLITAIGMAHRKAFKTEEDIVHAKAEIFNGLKEGGTAIINQDNRHFDLIVELAQKAGVENIKGYGVDAKGAEASTGRVVAHEDCTCLTANIGGQSMMYKIGMPGNHWVSNSLGVLLAVQTLGADLGLAGLALAEMLDLSGRGERFTVETRDGDFTLIDESYNANPLSMAAAIEVLGASIPKEQYGRRVAILSDMLELGEASTPAHTALPSQLMGAGVEKVFVKGEEMTDMAKFLPDHIRGGAFDGNEALIAAIRKEIVPGDVVMVKGSNAGKLGDVVDALLHWPGGLAHPKISKLKQTKVAAE
jgi:UDP-N-acetylmuramoyl-tripeptide--D-alanyl-D-alanine ligase